MIRLSRTTWILGERWHVENRRRILASYDDAAADPEFMAELGETMRDWDCTVADGLDAEAVTS